MTSKQKNMERAALPAPPAGLGPEEAAALVARLAADPGFVAAHVLPLVEEARSAEEWYVGARADSEDGSASLRLFVWPAGTRTKVHDHSSWGALACAFGSVLEERYERTDDGSVLEHARLRLAWGRAWGVGDGASTVQPGDGGIHRVGNPRAEGPAAVSIHVYGPRLREADGRDYDPSREYVCDRFDED